MILKETNFTLPTADGHKIYGVLNQAHAKKLAPRAVVLAHGLTGHMNEAMMQFARHFFNAKGWDVIRFNFYAGEANARTLRETTLAIHAEDLATVFNKFHPKYEKVYIAGHSYGGLTALIANLPANATSLWDPSYNPYKEFMEQSATYKIALKAYLMEFGVETVVGNKMVEESKEYDAAKCCQLAENFKSPVQMVIASNGCMLNSGYVNALKEPKDIHTIAGAGHCFYEGNTLQELLNHTHTWFKGF